LTSGTDTGVGTVVVGPVEVVVVGPTVVGVRVVDVAAFPPPPGITAMSTAIRATITVVAS
jgi:hypothetical protein